MSWFSKVSKIFGSMFGKEETPPPSPPAPIAQPTPVPPVPITPTVPTPTTPQASLPGMWPATHNWGDWRDVQEGESPEAYLKRTGLGGYGKTSAQIYQESADRQPQTYKDDQVRQYNGPVSISVLTDDDKRFLIYAQENFRLPGTSSELFFAILNGKKFEIDQVIGWADAHRWGAGSKEPGKYSGPMRGYVDQVSKGTLKSKPS